MATRGKRRRRVGKRWANIGLTALAVLALGSVGFAVAQSSQPATSGPAWTPSPEPTTPAPTPVRPTRLLVFGHSMAAGRGASDPSRSYAQLVGKALRVPVSNYAVGGAEFPATEQVVASKPVPKPSDLVVLHIGLNDIDLRGTKPSLAGDGYVAMQRMLDRLTGDGAKVVVLTECRPRDWTSAPAPYDHGSPQAFATWNRVVTQVAQRYAYARLVTACTTWDPARYTDVSRYHPNDAGHALIAAAIEKAAQS